MSFLKTGRPHLLAACCIALFSVSLPGTTNGADAPAEITLGEPQVLLTNKAFGLKYFPDGSVAFLETSPKCRLLLASQISSYLLEGPSPDRLESAKLVLKPGGRGEFDNGYAGVNGAVCRGPSGEILVVYHGEDQEGMKTIGQGIPGFYCRVALAVSRDNGATFQKLGPIIESASAKDTNGPTAQGEGEPFMVAEPSGKYLYVYYTMHNLRAHPTIGLARCPVAEALDPKAWRKFYAGDFTEPGLGGRETPVMSDPDPRAGTTFSDVVFVPSRNEFVMVYCLYQWGEEVHPERTGFYLAYSKDGIHWPAERRQQFWKVPVLPVIGWELAWHPTWLPEPGNGPELKGWLYYSYSPSWGHRPPQSPHYFVRRWMEVRTR